MDAHHINRLEQACRPLEHLANLGRLYPKAWRQIEKFRASKGRNILPNWPEWCFLPMAGFYAIVSKQADVVRLPPHLLPDVSRLAAIGTWRHTKGIYLFDPDVRNAAMLARVSGEMNYELLYRLPEWCVYIETPDQKWGVMPLHGFFAHAEWEAEKGRAALRLLLDCEGGLFPCPTPLPCADVSDGTVSQTTEADLMQSMSGGGVYDMPPENVTDGMAGGLEPLVSMVYFLCGEYADIRGHGDNTLGNPMQKHVVEDGWYEASFDYAPETVRRWQVGERTGCLT